MSGGFEAVDSDAWDGEHVEVTASMHLLALEVLAGLFAADSRSLSNGKSIALRALCLLKTLAEKRRDIFNRHEVSSP